MEVEVRDEIFEDLEDEEEFGEFAELKESAPDDVIERLQKRVRVAQVGKDLVEKQAFAFWTVIDTFLRLFFAPREKPEDETKTGEK